MGIPKQTAKAMLSSAVLSVVDVAVRITAEYSIDRKIPWIVCNARVRYCAPACLLASLELVDPATRRMDAS